MVKYGETSWLLGIVGLLALALFLAFFSGLIGPLIKLALARAQLALFLIPALWVSKDLVVEKIFGGFPWCLAGYSQYRHTYFSQAGRMGRDSSADFFACFFQPAGLSAIEAEEATLALAVGGKSRHG